MLLFLAFIGGAVFTLLGLAAMAKPKPNQPEDCGHIKPLSTQSVEVDNNDQTGWQTEEQVMQAIADGCADGFLDLSGDERQTMLNCFHANWSEPEFTRQMVELSSVNEFARLRLFFNTGKRLISAWGDWVHGADPDVLEEFPAAELVLEIEDAHDGGLIRKRWKSLGGRFFDGRMIALKGSTIWQRLSDLGLPFPPYSPDSGYGLADVDRDEAEELGVFKTRTKVPPVKPVRVDAARLASAIRSCRILVE